MGRIVSWGFVSVAVAIMLLARPMAAHAVALSIQLTIDELEKGRAVLSGDLDDTVFDVTGFARPEVTGTHWFVRATMSQSPSQGAFGYDLTTSARHISRPPPHAGEASPGLLLGGFLDIFHGNLGGLDPAVHPGFTKPGPQDDSHKLIHPGSVDHFDFLSSHVDDLNGGVAGFLTADNQLSVRIDLTHTPEPSSVILLGSGLLGVAVRRRRRRA